VFEDGYHTDVPTWRSRQLKKKRNGPVFIAAVTNFIANAPAALSNSTFSAPSTSSPTGALPATAASTSACTAHMRIALKLAGLDQVFV
jgi:hypothetical protein